VIVVKLASDVPLEGRHREPSDLWSVQALLRQPNDPSVLTALLEIYNRISADPHGLGVPALLRTTLGIDHLRRSIEHAVYDGRLVVLSQEAERAETPTTELVSQAPVNTPPQPQAQEPSAPPPKPEEHSFSICFVDEVDQPIAGVALELLFRRHREDFHRQQRHGPDRQEQRHHRDRPRF